MTRYTIIYRLFWKYRKFVEVKRFMLKKALEESLEGIMIKAASIVLTSMRLPLICAPSHYLMATQPKLFSSLAPTYHLYIASRSCKLL
jgi:3-deoxy-D-manno-octulosonic-acid transferase